MIKEISERELERFPKIAEEYLGREARGKALECFRKFPTHLSATSLMKASWDVLTKAGKQINTS